MLKSCGWGEPAGRPRSQAGELILRPARRWPSAPPTWPSGPDAASPAPRPSAARTRNDRRPSPHAPTPPTAHLRSAPTVNLTQSAFDVARAAASTLQARSNARHPVGQGVTMGLLPGVRPGPPRLGAALPEGGRIAQSRSPMPMRRYASRARSEAVLAA